MSTPDFDELEQEALAEAGRAGAAYLKSIKAKALLMRFGELEPEQAMEFLERIVDGFGSHLRAKLVAPQKVEA